MNRSAEHYARVERERLVGEPFFVALIRVAYEDCVKAKGTAEAAWELLGYIAHTQPAPAIHAVPSPAAKPHANKGRVLSEEHRAKLREASAKRWERYRAQRAENTVEKINGSIARFMPAEL